MRKTFEMWKFSVGIAMQSIAGVEPDEIDDWDYYTAYEDGVSPSTAAMRALQAAGYPEAG